MSRQSSALSFDPPTSSFELRASNLEHRACYHALAMSEEPSVTELMVRGVVVGVVAENCWIIGSRRTGEGICIDPGDQPDEILALARDMGVTIKAIANSHAHIDHILGVRGVQQSTGAKFLLHPQDIEIARSAGQHSAMMLGRQVEPPPDPDFNPVEGDEIEVDGLKLTVI